MRGRRFLVLLAVFGSGAIVGGLALRNLPARSPAASEAQRRALAMLDRPPVLTPIADSKIVLAVRRLAPAVVNIDIVGRVKQSDDNGRIFYMDQEVRGKGSGVVITPDGYIVTNDHVIEGASRIRVTFADGKWQYARLVGRDQERDIAVVRVDAHDLPCAEMADSDKLQVGESVVAIGNPMGLGSSVSAGIVSALNRHNLQIDDAHNLDGAIQTDAAINRGNSGGALANANGQLIGINTAILSSGSSGGSIGLGFALPINSVRATVRFLIAEGKPPRPPGKPWIGVEVEAVPEILRESLSLPPAQGVHIARVLPETPASLAGLHTDDILLRMDGRDILHPRDVSETIARHKPGDKVVLRIVRPEEVAITETAKKRERDITVIVQEHPSGVSDEPEK